MLLAQDDLADLVIFGGDPVDHAEAAGVAGFVSRAIAGDWAQAAGSHIVVLAGASDVAGQLRTRCPDAVVIVAGDGVDQHVNELLAQTRFPRGRVIGVTGGPLATAATIRKAVQAILLDRGTLLTATVMCAGEHGHEGPAVVPVVVGARGVQEIL